MGDGLADVAGDFLRLGDESRRFAFQTTDKCVCHHFQCGEVLAKAVVKVASDATLLALGVINQLPLKPGAFAFGVAGGGRGGALPSSLELSR